MSVGKESIKRAASAGTKKSTVNVLAEEVKAAAESKAAEAAKSTTAVKKTTRTKAAAARKTSSRTTKSVKTSVLTPQNTQELQDKVLSGKKANEENSREPVRITEELPVYLL